MTTAARSERHLGFVGATGIGVGSMLGAGVFAVWAPAAAAAGSWLVAAVALAAVVAAINAFSTAQLAALHPVAGGVYTYGSRELAPVWGFVAGIGFVLGKTASVAAMALTIGAYAWPDAARPIAALAVLAAWALNARGVTRTAAAATVVAGVVLTGLAAVAGVAWTGPAPAATAPDGGAAGVLEAAALVFFAFAGYARLATLGEEVRDPRRTIPRAIAAAMIVVVTVYVVLAFALSHAPGIEALAASDAPLADAVPGAWRSGVAVLAALAAGGAMLALLAGLGRTSMAMARERDLPASLARTNARGVPALAEAATALVAIGLAWWGDLGFALAMSSVSVLTYYGVANAAAFAAASRARGVRVPRIISALGVVLCAALALSLPSAALVAAASLGIAAVGIRAAVRTESRRRRTR